MSSSISYYSEQPSTYVESINQVTGGTMPIKNKAQSEKSTAKPRKVGSKAKAKVAVELSVRAQNELTKLAVQSAKLDAELAEQKVGVEAAIDAKKEQIMLNDAKDKAELQELEQGIAELVTEFARLSLVKIELGDAVYVARKALDNAIYKHEDCKAKARHVILNLNSMEEARTDLRRKLDGESVSGTSTGRVCETPEPYREGVVAKDYTTRIAKHSILPESAFLHDAVCEGYSSRMMFIAESRVRHFLQPMIDAVQIGKYFIKRREVVDYLKRGNSMSYLVSTLEGASK